MQNKFDKEAIEKELNMQLNVSKDFLNNAHEVLYQVVGSAFEDKQTELENKHKEIIETIETLEPAEVEAYKNGDVATVAKIQAERKQAYRELQSIKKEFDGLQFQKELGGTVIDVLSGNLLGGALGIGSMINDAFRAETYRNSLPLHVNNEGKEVLTPSVLLGDQLVTNLSLISGADDKGKLGGTRTDMYNFCAVHCIQIEGTNDYMFVGYDEKEFAKIEPYIGRKDDESKKKVDAYKKAMAQKAKNKSYAQLKDEFKIVMSDSKTQIGQSGLTGGMQGYTGTIAGIPYEPNTIGDFLIESFAGFHDWSGGQAWGFYEFGGNTSKKGKLTQTRANITTALAIGWSAPPAIAAAMTDIYRPKYKDNKKQKNNK